MTDRGSAARALSAAGVARRSVRRMAKRSRSEAGPRARALLGRKPRAHLLHPGKTGGTAIKAALGPVRTAGRYEIRLHEHRTTLLDIPRGEKVFFVVRDPVERYVSAFNSRLRQGRPRYHIPWTDEERRAFERFPAPDDLACALSDDDAETRAQACVAISSIQHVRDSYWRWFIHGQLFGRRSDDLLLVMWLPDLTDGFPRLRSLLDLPDTVTLPRDDAGSHRSPSSASTQLSELGKANIQWWHARDYGFIETCAQLECFLGPSWHSALATHPGRVQA